MTEQQKMLTLLKMGKDAKVISSTQEPRKPLQFGDFTIIDKDSFDTALSMVISAQTELVEKKLVKSRDMLNSYFDGMKPTDIAHQYADDAAASSELPPNLQPGAFALVMPSQISFKALRIVFSNPEQYNIDKAVVDEFNTIAARWDVALVKSVGLKNGRDLYTQHIYRKFKPID